MEREHLEYLLAAAATGHFGRAAEALGISTATISRGIGRLEDELGLSLFERGGSGVRLTSGGQAVTLQARRALAELAAVSQAGLDSAHGEVGQIRLGIGLLPAVEPLTHLLQQWRRSNPGVRLTISEGTNGSLAAALNLHQIDLALMAGHTVGPHWVTLPLYAEPLCLALPVEHPLGQADKVGLKALTDTIVHGQGAQENSAELNFYSSLLGPGVQFRLHQVSYPTLLLLASANGACALVPHSLSSAGLPGMVFRPFDGPNPTLKVCLAWLPGLEDPVVGRFVAFLRDAVRSKGLV